MVMPASSLVPRLEIWKSVGHLVLPIYLPNIKYSSTFRVVLYCPGTHTLIASWPPGFLITGLCMDLPIHILFTGQRDLPQVAHS